MPIPITDQISTTSPVDTYATHDASMGKGGHRTVNTISELLAIPEPRRVAGMLVHSLDTDALYKLCASNNPWTVISSNVTMFTYTADIIGVSTLKVGDYVYFNDTQTMHRMQENLLHGPAISGAVPSYILRTVANNTMRDSIPEQDRFVGMIVYSTAETKHYKLLALNYNSNKQFTPSPADWEEITYTTNVTAINDISEVRNLASSQKWPFRQIFIVNESKYIKLSLTGNEWEEVVQNEHPFYIVDTVLDLQTVPAIYRKPGLLVYVTAENVLYTRNTANTLWINLNSNGMSHSRYTRIKHVSNTHGGSALKGDWRLRNLSLVTETSISGLTLSNNTITLPTGRYFVRGFAVANGVGANLVRLLNTNNQQVLLQGDSVFAGSYNTSTVELEPTMPNVSAPIEGYFETATQVSVQLQHLVSRDVTDYGFGVVGGGLPLAFEHVAQSTLGAQATLVDLQIWKVS